VTTSQKYTAWFDLGAERFRAWADLRGGVPLPDEPVYPCPLRGHLFTKSDLLADRLSAEDVPPKSVGGKPMLPTWRRCNNDRGGRVEPRLEA
jgi:hypothetical protein